MSNRDIISHVICTYYGQFITNSHAVLAINHAYIITIYQAIGRIRTIRPIIYLYMIANDSNIITGRRT